MGRGSNGNGSTRSANSKSASTEIGYSSKMKKNILETEKEIRKYDYEQLAVFDDKGNLIAKSSGDNNSVDVDVDLKDKIVTHNHPAFNHAEGFKKIGSSFSSGDIENMINGNLKELRVVTSTYTFSVKRPNGGWGVNGKKAASEMWSLFSKHIKEYGNSEYFIFMSSHLSMRAMAKKYGWIYTKKRG